MIAVEGVWEVSEWYLVDRLWGMTVVSGGGVCLAVCLVSVVSVCGVCLC